MSLSQDGTRSEAVCELAKAAKKKLRIGKATGPGVYSKINSHQLQQLQLNKREREALDINYASLWDTWLHIISLGPGPGLIDAMKK